MRCRLYFPMFTAACCWCLRERSSSAAVQQGRKNIGRSKASTSTRPRSRMQSITAFARRPVMRRPRRRTTTKLPMSRWQASPLKTRRPTQPGRASGFQPSRSGKKQRVDQMVFPTRGELRPGLRTCHPIWNLYSPNLHVAVPMARITWPVTCGNGRRAALIMGRPTLPRWLSCWATVTFRPPGTP